MSQQDFTGARSIAYSVAAALANDPEVASVLWKAPKVFLDTIGPNVDFDDGAPGMVVSAASEDRVVRGDRTTQVGVVVFLDASADPSSSTDSAQDDRGVYVLGCGGPLQRLVEEVVAAVERSEPGALLDNAAVEYDYGSSPVQFATVVFDFTQMDSF